MSCGTNTQVTVCPSSALQARLSRLSIDAIPKTVIEICARLRSLGHGAWVVGGSLRDAMIGRIPGDWDIATTAKPPEVMRAFRRVAPTGIAHGTVTVLLNNGSYEVTTLRREGSYTDRRRPDQVVFIQELKEDLARRDFTVNAFAFDPLTGALEDPFCGLQDLEKRLLRAVGEPRRRFSEDGLRVLRAARLAATLQFDLESETASAISESLDSLRAVSHERVRDEWLKAMNAEYPSQAFEIMREYGILEVVCLDLLEEVGCGQNRCHAYDVWKHTMVCVDAAPKDPVIRLAALLHDMGKPRTRAMSEKTEDYTFYGHERVGADMADDWLREYRFSNRDRERVVHLIRHHLVCYSEEWSDAAVRRFIRRVGLENLDDLLHLARADVLAKGRPVEQELQDIEKARDRVNAVIAAGAALGIKNLAINGNDIMLRLNTSAGPVVGRILNALLERVLEDPSINQRDRLLALVDEIAKEQEA